MGKILKMELQVNDLTQKQPERYFRARFDSAGRVTFLGTLGYETGPKWSRKNEEKKISRYCRFKRTVWSTEIDEQVL